MQNNVIELFLCSYSVAVVLEPKKRKSVPASTAVPAPQAYFICHEMEMIRPDAMNLVF